jgi:type II secretion system (T2SS) protein E
MMKSTERQSGISSGNQSQIQTCSGQLLLRKGLITELQLLQGLHYHKTHGISLGQALLKLKFITERSLKLALAELSDIQLMPVDYVDFVPPNLTGYIEKEYAWRHKVCPIRRTQDHLTIVINDPTDFDVVDFIRSSTKLQVIVYTAAEAVIVQLLARLYGPLDTSPRKALRGIIAPIPRITVERVQHRQAVRWRVVRWSNEAEWTTCGVYQTQVDAESVRHAICCA